VSRWKTAERRSFVFKRKAPGRLQYEIERMDCSYLYSSAGSPVAVSTTRCRITRHSQRTATGYSSPCSRQASRSHVDEDLPVPVQRASAHVSAVDAAPACVLRYRRAPCCLLWDGKHRHLPLHYLWPRRPSCVWTARRQLLSMALGCHEIFCLVLT
jgi:hypothetical protein